MSPAARESPSSDWLLFLAPSAIWGTTWFAIKFQLGLVAPEVSVLWRFSLAALLLLAFCTLRGRSLRFSSRDHARLALLGLLQYALNYVLIYLAERHLASGLVALLFALLVVWNIAGARLVFGTPVTAGVAAGAALGLAGVTLVLLPDLLLLRSGDGQALGVLLTCAGTLTASAGNLWSQKIHRAGIPVLQGTALSMAYGALAVGLYCAVRRLPFTFDPSPAYLLSLAYLALFGSVFAFLSYLTLLHRIGAGRAGYTSAVIPVLAMATSTVFEGYRWTAAAGLGMALVVGGNVLILRKRVEAAAPPRGPAPVGKPEAVGAAR